MLQGSLANQRPSVTQKREFGIDEDEPEENLRLSLQQPGGPAASWQASPLQASTSSQDQVGHSPDASPRLIG